VSQHSTTWWTVSYQGLATRRCVGLVLADAVENVELVFVSASECDTWDAVYEGRAVVKVLFANCHHDDARHGWVVLGGSGGTWQDAVLECRVHDVCVDQLSELLSDD
jgi:hypothetical protein